MKRILNKILSIFNKRKDLAHPKDDELNTLLSNLPEHDVTDEVIERVLEKTQVVAKESKLKNILNSIKNFLIFIPNLFYVHKRRTISVAVGCLAIMVVLSTTFSMMFGGFAPLRQEFSTVSSDRPFESSSSTRGAGQSFNIDQSQFKDTITGVGRVLEPFDILSGKDEKVAQKELEGYRQSSGERLRKQNAAVPAAPARRPIVEQNLNREIAPSVNKPAAIDFVRNKVEVQEEAFGNKQDSPVSTLESDGIFDKYQQLNESVYNQVKNSEQRRSKSLPKAKKRGFESKAFLDEDEAAEIQLEDLEKKKLQYKQASGYWSNTYIPGDPVLRRLQTVYDNLDHNSPAKLRHTARRTTQPFDLPSDSALALYLHSDQTWVEKDQRMILQVGIQGTKRHGRYRPPMNMGLVIDLRDKSNPEYVRNVRALIRAFQKERLSGDKFSLSVIGDQGGVLIQPEEFKHGKITLTLENLFDKPQTGQPVNIYDGLAQAYKAVQGEDNPDLPLGSSSLLFVTNQSLGQAVNSLSPMVHEYAVNGISLSTIGIGNSISLDDLDLLALSGQGSRRIMNNASQALELANKELNAVSKVVARAVRLRIRLAPGVKLVDIYGSQSLDDMSSNRVRQAEKSIDLRLARNLGLTADRGEDEEGIQIVIPAFHADDSHVFLLDVVAPEAGPIADVQIRYKDLVHLKNSASYVNFSLDNQPRDLGLLELNVIKNKTAFLLAKFLEEQANQIERGANILDVQKSIRAKTEEIQRLQSRYNSLRADDDLINDLLILKDLDQALAAVYSGRARQDEVASSMRLSGKLKTLPQSDM